MQNIENNPMQSSVEAASDARSSLVKYLIWCIVLLLNPNSFPGVTSEGSDFCQTPLWKPDCGRAITRLISASACRPVRCRLRRALDRGQAACGKSVDAGPLAARVVDDRPLSPRGLLDRLTSSGAPMPRTTSHSVWPSATVPVVEGRGLPAAPSASAVAPPPGGAMPGQPPSVTSSSGVTAFSGLSGGVSIDTLRMNTRPVRENQSHPSTSNRLHPCSPQARVRGSQMSAMVFDR